MEDIYVTPGFKICLKLEKNIFCTNLKCFYFKKIFAFVKKTSLPLHPLPAQPTPLSLLSSFPVQPIWPKWPTPAQTASSPSLSPLAGPPPVSSISHLPPPRLPAVPNAAGCFPSRAAARLPFPLYSNSHSKLSGTATTSSPPLPLCASSGRLHRRPIMAGRRSSPPLPLPAGLPSPSLGL